ncbi:hypothetical protein [uncultured Novosphingobium sp.]|uniref:hypothetical protein n=1 Tax=uncultured Novosphingobium sp. TaxID=292277 RepID=UPI003747CAF6
MPQDKTLEAPDGRATKVLTFSSSSNITISVPVAPVGLSEDGTEAERKLVEAPLGSHALFCQARMCGDWYAEFTAGKRIACAVAETQPAAIRLAAYNLSASA